MAALCGRSYGRDILRTPLDDFFYWEAIIEGPVGTPYEVGTFILDVVFPMEYQIRPPKVKFKTPVYHPNISKKGLLNLDILKDGWYAGLTLPKVLLCVRCLLVDDINPDDPLEPDIAFLYKTDRAKYEQRVDEEICNVNSAPQLTM